MRALVVSYEGQVVGRAFVEETLRGEGFGFQYDGEWLENGGFPISVRLPLREAAWGAEESHRYFANLLPEGPARLAIAERLGLSPENDVGLLVALGDDTAGALRFTAEDGEAREVRERREIGEEELARWVRGDPALVAEIEELPRLSLAGAQHKIGVVLEEGRYFVPAMGEASTHLLKFDALRFSHLASNEFLTTCIAEELGLPVVGLGLDGRSESPFLVIRRYDRVGESRVRRLHQEDFCQILGHLPQRKYESEGGPGVKGIAEAIRRVSAAPAGDLLVVLRWALFNAVVANADGHGKNLSMVYGPGGLRLAPCYDLVCTGAYEQLDRRLAMAIGGERNPDRLRVRHAEELARAMGVRPRQGRQELARLVEEAPAALLRAEERLEAAVGFSPAAERVRRVVEKRVRAIGNNLVQNRE